MRRFKKHLGREARRQGRTSAGRRPSERRLHPLTSKATISFMYARRCTRGGGDAPQLVAMVFAVCDGNKTSTNDMGRRMCTPLLYIGQGQN